MPDVSKNVLEAAVTEMLDREKDAINLKLRKRSSEVAMQSDPKKSSAAASSALVPVSNTFQPLVDLASEDESLALTELTQQSTFFIRLK